MNVSLKLMLALVALALSCLSVSGHTLMGGHPALAISVRKAPRSEFHSIAKDTFQDDTAASLATSIPRGGALSRRNRKRNAVIVIAGIALFPAAAAQAVRIGICAVVGLAVLDALDVIRL